MGDSEYDLKPLKYYATGKKIGVAGTHASTIDKEKHVGVQYAGVKKEGPMGSSAEAHFLRARAGCSKSAVGVEAHAHAEVAQAAAEVKPIPGWIEARAEAAVLQAKANASADLSGLHAGAKATVARAEAGIAHTPLKAHVEAPTANAEFGLGLDYAGANVGAHLAEGRLGPVTYRYGLKFGAGIRNGVPEVHYGPVSFGGS